MENLMPVDQRCVQVEYLNAVDCPDAATRLAFRIAG
jgi:hypothetical protein